MKDFLGQDISIGDVVIANDKRYSRLEMGRVIALTPKYARVKIYHSQPAWNGEQGQLYGTEQICKIDSELASVVLLKTANFN